MGTINNVTATKVLGVPAASCCNISSQGYPFYNVANLQGNDYSYDNWVGFYFHGTSAVTEASNAELVTTSNWFGGVYLQNVSGSNFNGILYSKDEGVADDVIPTQGDSPGLYMARSDTNNNFNILVDNGSMGYGAEIYGQGGHGSSGNTFNTMYYDSERNPSVSIGGGSYDNTIGNLAAPSTTHPDIGLNFGEATNPAPNGNLIHTYWSGSTVYGCVTLARGAYENTIGDYGGTLCNGTGGHDVRLSRCNSESSAGGPAYNGICGTIQMANQGPVCTAANTPSYCTTDTIGQTTFGTNCSNFRVSAIYYCVRPYGNTVDGLYAYNNANTPTAGVYMGPGSGTSAQGSVAGGFGPATAANVVVGHMATGFAHGNSTGYYWYDDSCVAPPTTGRCGNTNNVSVP
jgi:hypothetical protein